ncbi:MAG: hypothetical protein OXH14_13350 [Alphaproteobacteria bacterium]|nr:hypothetical protein [Alphaproteobacteria bacterium]
MAESCDSTVCTVVFQGETAVIDLRDVHPDSPEVTITGQQTRNGVQTGRATASGGKLGYDTLGVWGNYNVGRSCPEPWCKSLVANAVSGGQGR